MKKIEFTDLSIIREIENLEYVLPQLIENDEDKYDMFLSALQEESSFMYKESIFSEKINKLREVIELDIDPIEISILQKLFALSNNESWIIPVEKMYCLSDSTVEAIVRHFKSERSYIDAHIATRHDIPMFQTLFPLIDYDDYKEIVFKHCCKVTSCCSNGNMDTQFNPFEKVYDSYNLKQEDYRELSRTVFCCCTKDS